MQFLQAKDKTLTKRDFCELLERVGIGRADCICVHTELFNLGLALVKKEQFLHILLSSFREILGPKGTLIMPTFTYDFCRGRDFDKRHNKSTMGILTEFFRRQEGVVRTDDPIYSFALEGEGVGDFLHQARTCFGEGCVYDVLSKRRGKIVLLGSDAVGYTFTHFIEERAGVGYRYYKKFSGKIIDEQGMSRHSSIWLFVRHLEKKSIFSLEKQRQILEESENFKREIFGNAPLVSIEARGYLEETLRALERDDSALL